MLHRAWAYLSVIFAIFARDVKRVLRNPVALVVVLGMAVMPSAYAWYVIAANWDPYSNTSGMKVAVANSDAGFDSSVAGRLDVGDQVVQQLQGNHELGWEFVGVDQAVNGVYEGEYWAAVVIPQDFSEDFASVFTGDFTRPTLDYYVNEKPSSIAPKVTDAGVDALQKAIDENFVKLVAERVVDTTQEAGEQAEGKGEAAQSNLTEGIANARETVGQAREAIGNLQVTIDSTKESAASADDTLARLQEGLGPLGDAVAEAKALLDEARATESEYGSSLATKATEGALVLGDVAAQAQREAASIEGAVQRACDDAQAALQRAQGLLEANENLIAALEAQAADPAIAADPQAAAAVAEALEQAKSANADLQTTVGALQQATDALGTTAVALETQAQAMDEAASAASESVRQTAADFQANVLPAMTGSLDELADACGTLQGALAGLSPTLSQARSVLGELETMLTSASSSLSTTSDALGTMESNLDQNLSDLQALQQSSTVRILSEYLEADPADVGAFMASPVTLETKLVYPVRNYGSGVAPFFTNLALWVAGFILMAIVRMRVDPAGLPRFTAAQAYFGRWLFYVVIGLVQGLVCCVGDLAIGIQCESSVAFIGAGLLTVFVDVNLMYALAFAFRHIGKAVAVILLIMQIPGSSGMFPIEMMPAFFQAIHPLLPFTYSIDAMREAIGGFYGLDYLRDMLTLGLVFVPVGLAIGLGIGRVDFNLNLMFDEKLAKTDLFAAEPAHAFATEMAGSAGALLGGQAGAAAGGGAVPGCEGATAGDGGAAAGIGAARFRTHTLVRALLNVDEFRESVLRRATRFRRRYKWLAAIGWAALFAQPIVTFALMVAVDADVDTRVEMLVAMVVGIIAVDVYLIMLSFMNTSLNRQLALTNLSPEGVGAQAASQLGGAEGASAPGDAPSGASASVPSVAAPSEGAAFSDAAANSAPSADSSGIVASSGISASGDTPAAPSRAALSASDDTAPSAPSAPSIPSATSKGGEGR